MQFKTIKVAIVDDHALVRKTLKNYLSSENNMNVVLHTSNAFELIRLLERETFDVLIIDVHPTYIDNYEALKLIRSNYPDIKIIVLSMCEEPEIINELLEFGIHAYVSKADEPENLVQAINGVFENSIYKNKLFTEALYSNMQLKVSNKMNNPDVLLEEREKKILTLLWEEKSNKEIANIVFLSVRSVEKIRQDMKEKIGARSTIGLLKFAICNRIIEPYKMNVNP
jgi:DNA-binding NarL/FixJ family response regulator